MRRTTAALAAAILMLTGGCQLPTPSPSASPSASSTPSPTISPSSPASTSQVLVYYLISLPTKFRLTREYRTVSGDPPVAAVEAMIAGPTDPDYLSTWDRRTKVLGVTRDATTITVNLSAEARTANVGSEAAQLMADQLIWTLTGVAGANLPVRLLIDGQPAGDLWGTVAWATPLRRRDALECRMLVQIDRPVEGARVTSPVVVTGEAAAFEANVPWKVTTPAGAVVASGNTLTTEGQTFAPFSFSLKLSPGTYVVSITEDDPSDGEGGPVATDTKTITVS